MFAVMMLSRSFVLLAWGESAGMHELMTDATRFGIPLAQVTVCFGLIILVTRQYAEELREASLTDALTGTLNRAGFEQRALRLLHRAQRDGRGVAMLMMDADHFKRINDELGHPAGDTALRMLVRAAREALRPSDLLGRHGGEEFVALLVDVSPQAAQAAAERLRATIAGTRIDIDGQRLGLTVSIGLSTHAGAGYELHRLVSRADAAVYRAKARGRNRVEIDQDMPPPSTAPAGAAGSGPTRAGRITAP
jgi:diguanylate cyclase (GGDEF)-like protein